MDSGTGGAVLAADDITSVWYQISKVAFGALDTAVLAIAGAGAVTTGTQRVTLGSDDPAVAALELIDDAIFVDDTATHATGTTKVMGIGAVATPTDSAVGANDIGMPAMSLDRRLHVDADIVAHTGAALDVSAAALVVSITDTSFAVADGNALGEGVLIQGDDGTDRKNINVDATTGDVQVDVTNTVTVDGSAVTQPVSGTVTANLSAVDNAVLDTIDAVLDLINAKLVTGTVIGDVNLGATDNAVLDAIDTVLDTINAKLVTGTVIGDVNLGATDNAVLDSIVTNQSARSAGGCKMFTSVDLDQTEEDPSAGATTIYGIYAWNLTAAPLWLQMFNTNTVTVGTTAPTNNFMIPANADSDGAGVVIPIPVNGLAYSTALTVAITTGSGTNNGAPGAGDAGIVILYQD